MIKLREKINVLKRLNDLVLYQWSVGCIRIAGTFIPLSELRLNVLTCTDGKIVYSSAAPILYIDKGRPVVQFRDSDLLTIIAGPRKGINIISPLLQEKEQAISTRHYGAVEVVDDNVPDWLENKILHMGTSATYPVTQVKLPELFRISRNPEALKPIFSTAMLRNIGGTKEDSAEQLLTKFHANIDLFGHYTDEGIVISNDYVITGGCCVLSGIGIDPQQGSAVHYMTLKDFKATRKSKHWKITVAGDKK